MLHSWGSWAETCVWAVVYHETLEHVKNTWQYHKTPSTNLASFLLVFISSMHFLKAFILKQIQRQFLIKNKIFAGTSSCCGLFFTMHNCLIKCSSLRQRTSCSVQVKCGDNSHCVCGLWTQIVSVLVCFLCWNETSWPKVTWGGGKGLSGIHFQISAHHSWNLEAGTGQGCYLLVPPLPCSFACSHTGWCLDMIFKIVQDHLLTEDSSLWLRQSLIDILTGLSNSGNSSVEGFFSDDSGLY